MGVLFRPGTLSSFVLTPPPPPQLAGEDKFTRWTKKNTRVNLAFPTLIDQRYQGVMVLTYWPFWLGCGVRSQNDPITSWSRLISYSNCFPLYVWHIQSVWAHWYAVHMHTVAALHSYNDPTWLRCWGSGSLVEWYGASIGGLKTRNILHFMSFFIVPKSTFSGYFLITQCSLQIYCCIDNPLI
jgi:hypothetical protein